MTQVHFGLFFGKRFPLSTGDLGVRARKPNGALVCSKKSKKTSPMQHVARARARPRFSLARFRWPFLATKKCPQMLQRKTQKRAPHKVIILQKKVIIFLAKMQ